MMTKSAPIIPVMIISWMILSSCGISEKPATVVDLSPASWPEGELDTYAKLGMVSGRPKPLVQAEHGMVVGNMCPLAARAGVEALRKGGTAADAALTASLAQVCLHAGSIVSYAGIMSMLYYDAETKMTYCLHGGWKSPKQETDPLSIPFMGTPSGRQVLVPGFMAGVQAAHQRFGKLPFDKLFEPAIYFAEEGFVVDKALASRIKSRGDVIARYAGTKAALSKGNGELCAEGDILKQPQLATTLKKVAREGAGFMYRGEWAEKFVQAVRSEGGKMTLDDLKEYEVAWSEPTRARYRDHEILAMGEFSFSGPAIAGAFNLLDRAELGRFGPYTRSPEALYHFIRISRAGALYNFLGPGYRNSRQIFSKYIPMNEFTASSWTSEKTAQSIWEAMQGPSWNRLTGEMDAMLREYTESEKKALEELRKFSKKRTEALKEDKHSDCVVAVDEQGNMAAVLHTINSGAFGYGLMVDGVTVPDTASFQQEYVAMAGPGGRLLDPAPQVIALQGGSPVLATSCIGGAYEATLQCVFNVLEYGMDPQAAVDAPRFLAPALDPADYDKQAVGEGDFSPEIVEAVWALGQGIVVIPKDKQFLLTGGWVGIKVDPKSRRMKGGVPQKNNGVAVGY